MKTVTTESNRTLSTVTLLSPKPQLAETRIKAEEGVQVQRVDAVRGGLCVLYCDAPWRRQ
jgi:hypothetical protein